MCQRIWATDKNAKKEIAQDKYDDVSTISQRNEMQFWECKVQKDGRYHVFFSVGVMMLCCFMIYLAKRSSYVEPTWIFQCSLLSELLSTQKRPKIYVTGLKMTWYLWHGCLLSTLVVLVPHFFWFHVEAAQPATIWQRTSEDLTGRSGVGKKKNKHSWNTGTLHFRRRNTHPLQENNIRIQLESSGHL